MYYILRYNFLKQLLLISFDVESYTLYGSFINFIFSPFFDVRFVRLSQVWRKTGRTATEIRDTVVRRPERRLAPRTRTTSPATRTRPRPRRPQKRAETFGDASPWRIATSGKFAVQNADLTRREGAGTKRVPILYSPSLNNFYHRS